jgi:hypothetical protein
MTGWAKDELGKIAETDDLHISPFRDDGKTYGTPTWIWSVVVDDGLYVRAYNGQKSSWYQAALRQLAGQITAAGIAMEVSFEPVEGRLNDRIDEAYRAKYKGSPYLSPMIGARARSATIKVSRATAKRGKTGSEALAGEIRTADNASCRSDHPEHHQNPAPWRRVGFGSDGRSGAKPEVKTRWEAF